MTTIMKTQQDGNNKPSVNVNTKVTVKEPITEPSKEVESVVINEENNDDHLVPTLEEINNKLDENNIQSLEEENKKVLEFLKDIHEDQELEVTDEKVKAYNEKIKERIDQIPDSTYETLINNIVNEANLTPEEKAATRVKLLARFKEQQAVVDELESAKSEFEESMAKIQLEMDAMFTDMDYIELLEKIDGLIAIANKHNQGKAVKYYKDLREEVDSILHLSRLKKNIHSFKNPIYIVEGALVDDDYKREYDKFFRILEVSKEYKFVDPSKLLENLENALPEDRKDNARIFLFALYRTINNPNKRHTVSKNAVFLEGIFRIIYSLNVPKENPLQKLKDEERDEFLNSLYSYVDDLKKLAEEKKNS